MPLDSNAVTSASAILQQITQLLQRPPANGDNEAEINDALAGYLATTEQLKDRVTSLMTTNVKVGG